MTIKKNFKPYPYAYFEGAIVPIEQAQISIMTNSLHYGIGIFGGLKIFMTQDGPAIFRLDDHLERMRKSVEILGFRYDFDSIKIKKIILELASKNNPTSTTYIRPLVYRSDTNISPDIAGDYELAVYMLDMPAYFDPSSGLKVCVSSWQRNSDNAIPPRTKATGGYINSALAIDEARGKGYDSAIMLDKNGNVSEGAVMNIFLVKDGELITPSLDSDILEGITRKTIIEIANRSDIKVTERKVKPEELYEADEVFFSGSATNITWCSVIDEKEISSQVGPITQKLISDFGDLPELSPELFTKI
ncbi:branched-chain amino acid transaminase [Candidatus Saccharibacteria bacterium]|nr:branched-chain amino acid transaminase [Candidatus Saccharibacteria bacterium]